MRTFWGPGELVDGARERLAELDAPLRRAGRRVVGVHHDGDDGVAGIRVGRMQGPAKGVPESLLHPGLRRPCRVEPGVEQAVDDRTSEVGVDAVARDLVLVVVAHVVVRDAGAGVDLVADVDDERRRVVDEDVLPLVVSEQDDHVGGELVDLAADDLHVLHARVVAALHHLREDLRAHTGLLVVGVLPPEDSRPELGREIQLRAMREGYAADDLGHGRLLRVPVGVECTPPRRWRRRTIGLESAILRSHACMGGRQPSRAERRGPRTASQTQEETTHGRDYRRPRPDRPRRRRGQQVPVRRVDGGAGRASPPRLLH